MAEFSIRDAVWEDAATLTAHNLAMARETEDRALDPDRARAGVETVLENPPAGFYLLVEHDGQIVGQLMITEEWSDWRNGRFWWIQSVYVVPQWRRQGVFSKMYDAVQRRALAAGDVVGLRLYVEKNNKSAKEVYRRLGMSETDYDLYETEFSPKSD